MIQPDPGEMISWPLDQALWIKAGQEQGEVTKAIGNRDAIFQEMLENNKTVFWICLGYAKDFIEAEELTQEVFFKAWTKIDSLRNPAKHRGWLFRMARNACFDHLKKKRLRKLVQLKSPGYDRDESTPEMRAVYRDELRLLKTAVQSLPRKLKDTFILRGYGGLSYREIAAVLEIKEGTVMSRLNEAREKIKSRMKE
jgi:RNA polymerase sigma-70 factor (ECF subfamily)